MATRYFVVFASAFRGDSAECISHETNEHDEKTFCGRKVALASTFEPDDNDLEADCNTCRKLAPKKRTPSDSTPSERPTT